MKRRIGSLGGRRASSATRFPGQPREKSALAPCLERTRAAGADADVCTLVRLAQCGLDLGEPRVSERVVAEAEARE